MIVAKRCAVWVKSLLRQHLRRRLCWFCWWVVVCWRRPLQRTRLLRAIADDHARDDRKTLLGVSRQPFWGIDADFNSYESRQGVLFFTPLSWVAREYASMDPNISDLTRAAQRPRAHITLSPTVYTVEVSPARIFDVREASAQEAYNEIRAALRAAYPDDPDSWLSPLWAKDGSPRAVSARGHLQWGRIGDLRNELLARGYDSMWVDEGSQGVSLAMFDWRGKVHGVQAESV